MEQQTQKQIMYIRILLFASWRFCMKITDCVKSINRYIIGVLDCQASLEETNLNHKIAILYSFSGNEFGALRNFIGTGGSGGGGGGPAAAAAVAAHANPESLSPDGVFLPPLPTEVHL